MIGKAVWTEGNLSDFVPKGSYDGYVWLSDKEYPAVLSGERFQAPEDTQSFVIEALLIDKEHGRSVHIRHMNSYLVVVYDLIDLKGKEYKVELMEFVAHRINGRKKLHFLRTWIQQEDPMCDDMKVWMPGELIFVGFDGLKSVDKEFYLFEPWTIHPFARNKP